jgi:hypothetical protein
MRHLTPITKSDPDNKVMTLDSDLIVYRKSRRKVIPLLRPER